MDMDCGEEACRNVLLLALQYDTVQREVDSADSRVGLRPTNTWLRPGLDLSRNLELTNHK